MKAEDIDLKGLRLQDIELQERIGRGGFGTVYKGLQEAYRGRSRRVAVKVFIASADDREEANKKFDDWGRDLKPLIDLATNAGIVQYYVTHIQDIIVSPDGRKTVGIGKPAPDEETFTAFFIVMEHADGGALGRIYREQVILAQAPQIFLSHFIDVCVALHEAHKRRIVHNDIKPENLLWFREANKVKIADFGIAAYIDTAFESGPYLRGSLHYMSPQAFELAAHVDARRDIYALGCTFYELLTGEKAFNIGEIGDDAAAVRDAFYTVHKESERPNAKQSNTEIVSFSLNRCLKLMMDADPDKRPSLVTVIEELESRKRDYEKIDLVPPTHDAMAAQAPRRNPRMDMLHLVSPKVREALNQRLFFLFITFKGHSDYKLNKLIYYLNFYFRRAYSFFEVYGKYDFVIRVWVKGEQRFKDFCSRVLQELLDDNEDYLNIISCEHVSYLNSKVRKQIPEEPPLMDWLVKIDEAQEQNDQAAIEFLENAGVYVRRVPSLDPKKCIKSFTLVQSLDSNEHERHGQHAQLLRRLDELKTGKTDFRFAVYKASAQAFSLGIRAPCDFVISYVSKSFFDVSVVPERILENFPGHRYRTITLLATGRYFIFSDGVFVE